MEMKIADVARDSRISNIPTNLSDTEVTQLINEATQLYEECMRIADLADSSEFYDFVQPEYRWDNPIGLVITG